VEHKLSIDTVDFDLHGIVGIRLLNPTPGDIAAVKRQLGPIQAPLSRTPDIVIRFVEQIPFSSPVRYLGVDDVGFTDDAFLVLRGKHKRRVKVQIPFDQIGNHQCQIVCESGLPAVPLLIPILNLTALGMGALPLHASAFNYNGKGILTTGWSKGGKTEMLLAFGANGAEYIGDEWVYLSSDGQHMYGIPEPIRVWYWHLQQMSYYKAMISKSDLVRLGTLKMFTKPLDLMELSSLRRGSRLLKLTAPINALLKKQIHVDLPPEKLFGKVVGTTKGKPDKVFFVANRDEPQITVQSINPQEIVQRMVFSLQEERREFFSYYRKFRFAFPEVSNSLIDQAEEIQRSILTRVMADKETYAVYHPYPFSIRELFEVVCPYCM
jgi:hypothetical protein